MSGNKFALAATVLALTLMLVVFLSKHAPTLAPSSAASTSTGSEDPRLVYSDNADDPWNRIFHSLFTRTLKVRMSDDFPDAAPFTPVREPATRLKASTRIFERVENGDRAIEPLYPSFFTNVGVLEVLNEPVYSELKTALESALAEQAKRPPLNRALMQIDAWAAFDIFYAHSGFRGPDSGVLPQRREELLKLLARFIFKIALSPDEIRTLPNTYSDASTRLHLPPVFAPQGEWVEVQLNQHRMHDVSADFRRSARVFFKPLNASVDKLKFLDLLRNDDRFSLIDSVALVVQNLLINSHGEVTPTWLTADVQVRKFLRDGGGRFIDSEVHQYELSRKALLNRQVEGGLIEITDNADLYFPVAGNDYVYAGPQMTRTGNDYPVLVKLKHRCEGCHGTRVMAVFTLSSHEPQVGPITMLSSPDITRGWYVAGRKTEREDFTALLNYWRRG
jgi:hypothetical protein